MNTLARPCRALCVALSLLTAFPFAGLAQQGPRRWASSGGNAPRALFAVLEPDASGSAGTERLGDESQEHARPMPPPRRSLNELLDELAAAEGDCPWAECAPGTGMALGDPPARLSGLNRWDEHLRLSRDVPRLPVGSFPRALDVGVLAVADDPDTRSKPKQPARPPAKRTAPAPAKPKTAEAKPKQTEPEKKGVAWYWWVLGGVAGIVVVSSLTQKSGGGGGGGGGGGSTTSSCSNCGSVGFAW